MNIGMSMRDYVQNRGSARTAIRVLVIVSSVTAILTLAWIIPTDHISYSSESHTSAAIENASTTPEVVFVPTHIETPEAVKAVYMTACIGGTPSLRTKMLTLFDGTELNSLVLDLKDYTGTISYRDTKVAVPAGGGGCRIADLPEFIKELHARGIYVIARITVFQDPLYAAHNPEWAVQSLSNPSGIWKDKNKLAFIDPGSSEYWDYIVSIGKEAYEIGFDELNFDYIRFPSDGNLADASFSQSIGRKKREVLRDFFAYLDISFASTSVPLSADLFGLTTSSYDDLGIGQVLEDALPYFDYIAPMVYPSHYAKGFNGLAKPAEHPYEVVRSSMDHAARRAVAASTTPLKLRPWLQDFNLGAIYTPAMVRAQMQATYDAGLTSWMLWNAANRYQMGALAEKGVIDMKSVETAVSTTTTPVQ
jgi:hypothetical protein